MCQVIPFTLPCCRKVYVEVSKLPSCPNSWPNRKCPPELCIQVRGYEAEDREAGRCWRCKAEDAGASDADREGLRPRIDKASLALGLDELGVSGRRRREERNGNCWFCGATGGCQTCGAKHIGVEEDECRIGVTGKRKREHGTANGKEREVIKKIKTEKRDQKTPSRAFEYSAPHIASNSQYPYPQGYNQHPQVFDQEPQPHIQDQKFDFPYNHVSQPDVQSCFEAGRMQQTLPANWQSSHKNQIPPSGPSNAYGQKMSQFADDGGQGSSTSQYYPNGHLLPPELGFNPTLYYEGGPSGANTGELWLSSFDLGEEDVKLKPQKYDRNEYPPCAYPDIFPEARDPYTQNNYAQGQPHSESNARQYRISQAVNNESQHEFKPEKSSLEESAVDPYLDPNIQPGLDGLPLDFNVAELDDATLARLLKQYSGGERSVVGIQSKQEANNEYGGSSIER